MFDDKLECSKEEADDDGGRLMWSRPVLFPMKVREPKIKIWPGAKSSGMVVDLTWSRSQAGATPTSHAN